MQPGTHALIATDSRSGGVRDCIVKGHSAIGAHAHASMSERAQSNAQSSAEALAKPAATWHSLKLSIKIIPAAGVKDLADTIRTAGNNKHHNWTPRIRHKPRRAGISVSGADAPIREALRRLQMLSAPATASRKPSAALTRWSALLDVRASWRSAAQRRPQRDSAPDVTAT